MDTTKNENVIEKWLDLLYQGSDSGLLALEANTVDLPLDHKNLMSICASLLRKKKEENRESPSKFHPVRKVFSIVKASCFRLKYRRPKLKYG